MKVWVLWYGKPGDIEIRGIYTSEALALDAIEASCASSAQFPSDRSLFVIEEHETDPPH